MEEELLLVDVETGRPRAVARQVLRSARDHGRGDSHGPGGSLDEEFQEQMLEIDSSPQSEIGVLLEELRGWRTDAASEARQAGARVLATGTSPFPADAQVVHNERFERVSQRFGLVAREQLTLGCHVHVSVASDEEAIGVLDRIRDWLPVLLALSANSPFWHGVDTDFASFRNQVFSRWPMAGPTDVFGSAGHYRAAVERMIATGVVLDAAMVYADARPSARYPTLEMRVSDVCADVRDTALIAALTRGLVETSARDWQEGRAPSDVPTRMLRLANWQASRFGVADQLLDPVSMTPCPARAVVESLLEHVAEPLEESGDTGLVQEGVERVFTVGTGAQRQRAVLERTGQVRDVVAELARVTVGQEDQPSG